MLKEAISIAVQDTSISKETLVFLETAFVKGTRTKILIDRLKNELHIIYDKGGYASNIRLIYILDNTDDIRAWLTNVNEAVNIIQVHKHRKVEDGRY